MLQGMQIVSSPNVRHILSVIFAEIDLMEAKDFPLPGSAVARNIGCTCPEATRDTANLDDPWFLDFTCPWHGKEAFEEHLKGARH